MKRRTAREKAIQCLFQMDLAEVNFQDAYDLVMEDSKEDGSFMVHLVKKTTENREAIDAEIKKYLRGWQLERIANVDRAILRLAFYEMMFEQDTPPRVIMNEAIELAKLFSDEQSSRFVNGVLSAYVQAQEASQV